MSLHIIHPIVFDIIYGSMNTTAKLFLNLSKILEFYKIISCHWPFDYSLLLFCQLLLLLYFYHIAEWIDTIHQLVLHFLSLCSSSFKSISALLSPQGVQGISPYSLFIFHPFVWLLFAVTLVLTHTITHNCTRDEVLKPFIQGVAIIKWLLIQFIFVLLQPRRGEERWGAERSGEEDRQFSVTFLVHQPWDSQKTVSGSSFCTNTVFSHSSISFIDLI